jgi:hypothetical protein
MANYGQEERDCAAHFQPGLTHKSAQEYIKFWSHRLALFILLTRQRHVGVQSGNLMMAISVNLKINNCFAPSSFL